MKLELLIALVGTFGTLALGINAFFLRGIFQDLNSVKVSLATSIANSSSIQSDVKRLEAEHEKLRIVSHNTNNALAKLEVQMIEARERLHTLEGMESTILQYLKDEK